MKWWRLRIVNRRLTCESSLFTALILTVVNWLCLWHHLEPCVVAFVAMGTPLFKDGVELPGLSRAKSKSNQIYLEPNSVCPSKGFTLSTFVTPSVLGPWTGSEEIRNLSDIDKWGIPFPGRDRCAIGAKLTENIHISIISIFITIEYIGVRVQLE